jgi:hypothetical protein
MKAYALNRIQRGKDATPRIVNAGTVFDATEDELLHLTPMGAVRKPTKQELAVHAWDMAEAEDPNADARELVARVFAEPETPVTSASSEPAAVDGSSSGSGETKTAKSAKGKASEKTKAEATPTPTAADDLTV